MINVGLEKEVSKLCIKTESMNVNKLKKSYLLINDIKHIVLCFFNCVYICRLISHRLTTTRSTSKRYLADAPCKHAVSCQYRACTGPMLAAVKLKCV